MNADLLLNHFDRIAEAPDAIPRLRRFILDLAVRGKLVAQDPNDEPAGELLKRIETCAISLGKKRKTGKQNVDIPSKANENWPIPVSWIFVPLEKLAGETGLFVDGDWVESKDQDPNGGVRLIQLADVGMGEYRNRSSRFMNTETAQRLNCTFLNPDDILIARMPDPLGRACIFPGDNKPSVTVVDVAILRPENSAFDSKYVVHTINSLPFARNVEAKAAGTTRSRISRGNLGRLPFPLPPLAEQHRIVAKVDELMALCDQLEAAKKQRETRRDQLVASSLNRLSEAQDPITQSAVVGFHLNHLPRLTTRPEHIKQLRQTILNLAVRGRLVEQDPNDEPAHDLLKRIEEEKVELIKAREIKKIDTIVSSARKIFNLFLPQGWSITSLHSICISITDGDHIPPPKSSSGIPFLVIGNVRTQVINFTESRFVPLEYYEALDPIRRPRRGDLLYTLVGSYGIPVIVRDDRSFCVQRHIGILRPSKLIDIGFLAYAMASQWIFDQATTCATGIAQKTVPLSGLRQFVIPLPPLAEQHRIVAKVDELMTLCDQLEAQLTNIQADNRRLLEAVLHQALGEN